MSTYQASATLVVVVVASLFLSGCAAGSAPVEGACYRARYVTGPKAQRYLRWDQVACPEDVVAGVVPVSAGPPPTATPIPVTRTSDLRATVIAQERR